MQALWRLLIKVTQRLTSLHSHVGERGVGSDGFASTRRARWSRKDAGFSLIEVLVALLVLAFGLLGVAGVQVTALKTAHSSAQKSEATMLAYLMLDAMRANRTKALDGSYNLAEWTCTPPSGGTLSQNDQGYWLQKAQAMLGTTTCGTIACDGADNCTVKLRWDDSRAGGLNQTIFLLTSHL
jgi:type IV pilus assembly protein PilV